MILHRWVAIQSGNESSFSVSNWGWVTVSSFLWLAHSFFLCSVRKIVKYDGGELSDSAAIQSDNESSFCVSNWEWATVSSFMWCAHSFILCSVRIIVKYDGGELSDSAFLSCDTEWQWEFILCWQLRMSHLLIIHVMRSFFCLAQNVLIYFTVFCMLHCLV